MKELPPGMVGPYAVPGKPGIRYKIGSVHPETSSKLLSIIVSSHEWEIRPIVGDPALYQDPDFRPTGEALWPRTIHSRRGVLQPDGEPGPGAGGLVFVPTSRSRLVYGYYDTRGVEQAATLVEILAHELLGHAYFATQGIEDSRDLSRAGRARHDGHDQAIKVENTFREEAARANKREPAALRGTSRSPKRGESIWKKKGGDRWFERPPTPDDLR
jgi:hypothetical protein